MFKKIILIKNYDVLILSDDTLKMIMINNVISCTVSVISPLHTISYQFLGAIPEHWCHLEPLVNANWTTTQILSLSLPDK